MTDSQNNLTILHMFRTIALALTVAFLTQTVLSGHSLFSRRKMARREDSKGPPIAPWFD
jgi:hypothetical protein